MKSWQDRWKAELDASLPELKPEVLNAPIPVSDEENPAKRTKTGIFDWLFNMNGARRTFAISAVAAVLVLCVCLAVFIRPQEKPGATTAFAVEINPSAVFSVDENSVVTNVVALNADADVIISSEERRAEIIGKPHAQAVKVFVDYAALLGYVDLSSMGAVKIIGCGEENTVVVDTVKQYFMDKGAYVAVVSASASMEDFCVLGGFSLVEGVDALVESIVSTPSLLAVRQSEGKSGDELEDLFVESYGDDALKASAEEIFMAEVEAVFNCSQDILLIVNKSLEIISSPDNPNIFLRDYWNILNGEDSDYTDEFAKLMTDMQGMLDEFEVNYGVKIESMGQLDELASEYSSDVMIILRELFDNFDIDKFLLNVKIFSRLFEDIGKDIEEAMGLPKTVEDYLVKAGDYYKSSYEKRKAEYKAVYEGSRESISASDYDAYINNVIAQYGSLEGYWQAQKNN